MKKLRSNTAILLPHDGPMSRLITFDSMSDSSTSLDTLVAELSRAPTVQLQCSILSRFKKENAKGYINASGESFLLNYRLLLEWSVSCQTPQHLHRAIEAMLKGYENPSTEQLREELLFSILNNDDSGSWKEPTEALSRLLASWSRWRPSRNTGNQVWPRCWDYCRQRAVYEMTPDAKGGEVSDELQRTVNIVHLSKMLLDDVEPEWKEDVNSPILDLTWNLLTDCRHEVATVLKNHWTVVGAVFGKLVVMRSDSSEDMDRWLRRIESSELESAVRQCHAWQGMLQFSLNASASDEDNKHLVEPFLEHLTLSSRHPDVGVRVVSLKAWCTIVNGIHGKNVDTFLQEHVLPVIQSCWTSPVKALNNAVASLFAVTVPLMGEEFWVHRQAELLPKGRGKYQALKILLQTMGVSALLEGSSLVLPELVEGMSDPKGHDSRVVTELWTQAVGDYLRELLKRANISIDKKTEDTELLQSTTGVLKTWCEVWVPSMARGLMHPLHSRRSKLASFLFLRINKIAPRRFMAAYGVSRILEFLYCQKDSDDSLTFDLERDTILDRRLWAYCEITRLSHSNGLFGHVPLNGYLTLEQTIAKLVTLDRLKEGLVHFSPTVRLAAWAAVCPVVLAHAPESPLEVELNLWVEFLPYCTKSSDHRYTSTLLQTLVCFLDRLSLQTEKETSLSLDEFMIEFLIKDVFLRKLAFPGSVVDRELFGLSLLEALLCFLCREAKLKFRVIRIHGGESVLGRSRSQPECDRLKKVRDELFSTEVVESLIMLLHSKWDSVQALAHSVLICFVGAAKFYDNLTLVLANSKGSFSILEEEAIVLSSSARQRESDTGAQLLSVLALSLPSTTEVNCMVYRLTKKLISSLDLMRKLLGKVDGDVPADFNFPMSHGIVRSLRLICANQSVGPDSLSGEDEIQPWRDLFPILSNALELSVSVVADVRDDEDDIGDGQPQLNPELINPGSIGANGIFSSVEYLSPSERAKLLTSQQVVVGSWLLTKQTSAAVSELISRFPNQIPEEAIEQAGIILISTLTCLKHTGAAYAAHEALQDIATACSKVPALAPIIIRWKNHLLDEVYCSNKVRDSTLRRSTGYALGFLSLLRAAVSNRGTEKSFRAEVIAKILDSTSPPRAKFEIVQEMFRNMSIAEVSGITDNGTCSMRSRVHSLNILRFIVLDAPLASAVQPFMGKAIVSALIGYTDESWVVRNSSTMLFSAILLRSVDANKNSTSDDEESSRRATTLSELFVAFPFLSVFLGNCLKTSISRPLRQMLSRTPLFPTLLLFCRIQPVRLSGYETSEQVAPFIPLFRVCLSSPHIVIRRTAARALANCTLGCSVLESIIKKTSESARNAEWNALHGNLTAIQQILKVSPVEDAPVSLLQECLLVHLAIRKTKPLQLPYSCASLALSLLSSIDGKLDSQTYESLISKCDKASPDSSGLVVQAVTIMSDHAFRGGCDGAIDLHSRLLQSISHDVRAWSSKRLKKHISRFLEKSSSTLKDGQNWQLLFLKALRQELNTSKQSMGAHKPTLRRLSRCLVLCLERSPADKSIAQELKDLGCELATYDRTLGIGSQVQNATQVTGNAAEIISHSGLQWDENFQKLLANLCSPTLPWRLRHSACSSMVIGGHNFSDYSSLLVRCLQDEDPDVRHMVSRYFGDNVTRCPEFSVGMAIRREITGTQQLLAAAFLSSEVGSIGTKIDSLLKDLQTLHAAMEGDLHRKDVFEEEEPNSYGDYLLPIQEAISVIGGKILEGKTHFSIKADSTNELLDRTEEVLNLLVPVVENGKRSMLVDPCRKPEIFTRVYELLLLSWFAVSMLPTKNQLDHTALAQVQSLAARLARSATEPLMISMASCIASPTTDDLNRCCFLVMK